MKIKILCTLALLLSVPGCWRKRKVEEPKEVSSKEILANVDVPHEGEEIQHFFEEDIEDFITADDDRMLVDAQQDVADSHVLAWQEETRQDDCKTIYFDFDSDRIRPDQEENIAYDVELIKRKIEECQNDQSLGAMQVVVEGHSCHSAGSSIYNLALSERRALKVKDRLVASGVPSSMIKIVGRGQEMPAIVAGKVVDGDRQSQWPNRRDEIRLIFS